MDVPGGINPLLFGAQGYKIERSLRFNSPDSAYLNRTPASAGDRRTWTWSGWVKRALIDTSSGRGLFTAGLGYTNDSDFFEIRIGTASVSHCIAINGNLTNWRISSRVFRDPSAWYHIVVAVDTTLATANDRIKLYVNGVQETSFSTINNPTQNANLAINSTASSHNIGRGFYDYFGGYIAETYLIDGQALTPSSFGETDTITGVWKPKKYTGTYGTNGFYLNFSDNSGTTSTTLGKDGSGNGNNWTPNNFSVTAGAGNDSLTDTPTPYADGGNGRGNYCTLNPIAYDASTYTLSNGSLQFSASRTASGTWYIRSTQAISSGKWYWEVTPTNVGGGPNIMVGIQDATISAVTGSTNTALSGYGYGADGAKYNNAGYTNGYGATYAANDVVGVAFDADAGTIAFYKNGVSQGTAYSGISGTYTPTIMMSTAGVARTIAGSVNNGQQPFAYTPPSGFLALNTQNLPDPTIMKPSTYMDVVTYTGTGAALTPTSSLGFSPDLVWIKSRSAATDHAVYDSARALQRRLETNTSDVEPTSDDSGVTALNSNGFTLGTLAQVNTNTATYAAWCWDESATPGFDIVTYTGNGTNGRQIAHSLGVRPSMYITACRSGATNYWNVWHSGAQSGDASERYQLFLNTTGARNANGFPASTNTLITSTNFTPAIASYDNVNTATYVAYLWSEVAGFSKFGSYTGNGSSDGPFVYCGFRPRWILVKGNISGNFWVIYDTARNTYNVMNSALTAQAADAEYSYTSFDALSNGFKIRATGGDINTSSNIYFFAAFAEAPFKYSLAR